MSRANWPGIVKMTCEWESAGFRILERFSDQPKTGGIIVASGSDPLCHCPD